ncbi:MULTISPECIES: hypothetical protein [unclassified Enterococcus]|uniref:hypothetical protein n=1 Tax=unclassified Enterococcus TaxID=2608891 RepID=UPI001551FB82|nr:MULTISPECIES: hypothetical protein [unclassified Enterococcus]MBS7576261.1 hypothetical protein [Enterococcus sp. MMGLQ5-2]MBS7583494.1 hypothetical protein [Enterococcus sp. MMGLQ5-1]NPD11356.1 hypothetical protein [Enterococcus sp. MMGLQ5-1]NPD36099.1 hypothetical protein [Enterococcus sp. MMGLQ5-2]
MHTIQRYYLGAASKSSLFSVAIISVLKNCASAVSRCVSTQTKFINSLSTAQHSTAPHRTAPHSTAPHSTAQHRTAQHRTAPHSTAQHSTVRSSWRFIALEMGMRLFCLLTLQRIETEQELQHIIAGNFIAFFMMTHNLMAGHQAIYVVSF